MFMHGPLDHAEVPDYRPAVHDSEGLAIRRSNGERIWRPLANPRELQISAFIDENPAGFGLVQRRRDFEHYQDLEAQYERRPSAWVQPLGDWGRGHVQLVEIPSDSEGNDNIVAYWRPTHGLRQGEPFSFAYRLTWPEDVSPGPGLARVVRSAGGRKLFSELHEVVIDYRDLPPEIVAQSVVHAAISRGRVVESRVQVNPAVSGARVFLTLETEGAENAEIRVDLKRGDEPVAETWLYRWLDEY
jgi:glucan biosynthesis protein